MTMTVEVSNRGPYEEVLKLYNKHLAEMPVIGDTITLSSVNGQEFYAVVTKRFIDYKEETVLIKAKIDNGIF